MKKLILLTACIFASGLNCVTQPQNTLIYKKQNGNASITAFENPNEFIIDITHPERFFHQDTTPRFVVTTDGQAIMVQDNKGFEYGLFQLPRPVIKQLWSTDDPEMGSIEGIIEAKTAKDTLTLAIPKDTTRSDWYYWWYKKPFYYSETRQESKDYQPSPAPFPYSVLATIQTYISKYLNR